MEIDWLKSGDAPRYEDPRVTVTDQGVYLSVKSREALKGALKPPRKSQLKVGIAKEAGYVIIKPTSSDDGYSAKSAIKGDARLGTAKLGKDILYEFGIEDRKVTFSAFWDEEEKALFVDMTSNNNSV